MLKASEAKTLRKEILKAFADEMVADGKHLLAVCDNTGEVTIDEALATGEMKANLDLFNKVVAVLDKHIPSEVK